MLFTFASRTMDVMLLVACSAFLGDTYAAVPYLDDEKEFIIAQLTGIIEDQTNRMRNKYPIRMDDDGTENDERPFTFSMASDLPEINTGDQDTPFAVLPNDRRYYQPDFTNHLVPPDKQGQTSHRYLKKERSKSSEIQNNYVYGSNGYVSSKVTTENSTTSEVSMDLPQSTYMHLPFSSQSKFSQDDYYFFAKAAGVGLAVLVVLIITTIACFRMQKNNKAAADIEYPAYGITGPNKDISPTGDRRLAQSAQMYHYQHQKQQIIAMESNSSVKESRCGSVSDPDSDDDNEEGDYTVYECPGLAPAGEMEVKNPLFHDDNTPASPNPNTSKDNIAENGVLPTVPVP